MIELTVRGGSPLFFLVFFPTFIINYVKKVLLRTFFLTFA
ncbi:hypothetical protein STRDD10_00794 [Streptococcus sp. DD10]|nr:hypothetical protein STRDD10_00794 [Streptococcus sp. DD10]